MKAIGSPSCCQLMEFPDKSGFKGVEMVLTQWILNMLRQTHCLCPQCKNVLGPSEVTAAGVRECGLPNSGLSVIFVDLRCWPCGWSVRQDLSQATLREFGAGIWCEQLFARKVPPSEKVTPSIRPRCSPAPISHSEAQQLTKSIQRISFCPTAPTWQRFLSALGVPEKPPDDLPF